MRSMRLAMAALLVLAVLPCHAAAAEKGAAQSKTTAADSQSDKASPPRPQITRIAVIESLRGEVFFRSPVSIARDPKTGELLVTNFEAQELVIIDRNGALVTRWNAQNGVKGPYGVSVDPAGQVYVSEMRNGLLKVFSPAGSLLNELDLSKLAGRAVFPGRVTLGQSGSLYVTDAKANEVLVLSGPGELIRTLKGFEYLQKAAEVNGQIITLSGQGAAVAIFDSDGKQLRAFGEHGSEPQDFSFPTGFAVDSKGRLWIADAFQHRLKVFSLKGEFFFNYGWLEEKQKAGAPGALFFPTDLCFGDGGQLFLLEKGADRLQVLQVSDLANEDARP